MTGAAPHNGTGPVSGPTTSSEEAAQALRLGADRPRITRLSRKVLAGGTALALLLISGAVLWALRSNHPHHQAPDELYSTDHHNVADGLTTLPQDYSAVPRDVPRLGPPLPGDPGRPIVSSEAQSGQTGLDAEQQRAPGNRGCADEQSICVDNCSRFTGACCISANFYQHIDIVR